MKQHLFKKLQHIAEQNLLDIEEHKKNPKSGIVNYTG